MYTLNKYLQFAIAACTLFISIGGQAQHTINDVLAAGGGTYSSPSGLVCTTIGEMTAVCTVTATPGSLTQGFQQPSGIINGLNNAEPKYSIAAYPNPVKDNFYLSCSNDPEVEVLLHVTNATGQRVDIPSFQQGTGIYALDFSTATEGLYTVHLTTTKHTQAFNIIKIR
jgi:hypothetical protein